MDTLATRPTAAVGHALPRGEATNVGVPLEALLSAARHATPIDRITYRDSIAAHGDSAIDALTPWLADARLRGFAIRTIARAGMAGTRERAIEVLQAVKEDAPHVRADIDEALMSLGARRLATPSSTGRPRLSASVLAQGRVLGPLTTDPLAVRTGVTRQWADGTTWTILHALTAADDVAGWALERGVRGRPTGNADGLIRLSQWDRVPGGGWRFHYAPPIIPAATLLELLGEADDVGMLYGGQPDAVLSETAVELLCTWRVGYDHAYRITRLPGDLVRLRWDTRTDNAWRPTNAAPTISPEAMRRVADWLR